MINTSPIFFKKDNVVLPKGRGRGSLADEGVFGQDLT
jgi:hypothetical protein